MLCIDPEKSPRKGEAGGVKLTQAGQAGKSRNVSGFPSGNGSRALHPSQRRFAAYCFPQAISQQDSIAVPLGTAPQSST